MHELLEKISEYYFLNCIVPGWCFYWLCDIYLDKPLLTENFWSSILNIFIIGLISNRIGSLFSKLILERFPCFKNKREEYNDAKNKNPFIAKLSNTRNMYRTFLGMFILYGLYSLACYLTTRYTIFCKILPFAVPIMLFALFLFSYYIQSKYIDNDIKETLKK